MHQLPNLMNGGRYVGGVQVLRTRMYRFTKQEIEDAARKSNSKTEMMRFLRIKQSGGGYQALDKWCKIYNIEPPNFQFDITSVKNFPDSIPINEWFVNGVTRNNVQSRKKLISMGFPNLCAVCGLSPEWNNKSLALQLDHINGDRWDNRVENLRIICPNCHTQTETYGRTNARKSRYYCACGKEIYRKSKTCVKCVEKSLIIDWPSIEIIVEQARLTNFLAYSKVLGVSDNAIRKHLISNGVDWRSIK